MNSNEQHKNTISLITKGQGAFLGAAVGDALGWSQEPEAKRIGKKTFSPTEVLDNGFQQWVRKSGGQYYPHHEVILAGEYSDDTQLILCTARSLLYGARWWHHFTKRELPTWTSYERGGGGATKRAAQQWLAGIEPWSSPDKEKKRYFDAGGNGVAMRILPHCLLSVTETNFEKIAKNIVANGVTTHGHPRALVGALAYGFAIWVALRETNTLQYGVIIEKVLSEVNSWSVLPDLKDICPNWKNSALQTTGGQYDESWQVTIKEMLQLLELCREGMKQGALSVEREVLTKLGCFDKNIKGAGTVSAAAAIFLASRFAANPFHGLLEAGFAQNADTDTLASMTGGILGAIAGIEWLGNYAVKVQDANYIRDIAEHLARNQGDSQTQQADNFTIKKTYLDAFVKQIEVSKPADTILIPDGRKAQISASVNHQSISKSTVATSWKLTTADGQSLYVKKLSRPKNNTEINSDLKSLSVFEHNVELQPVNILHVGIEIPVSNLEKSRFFYEKVLGIKVEQESKSLVKCGSIVLITLEDYKKRHGLSSETTKPPIANTIYLVVKSFDEAYNNVSKVGAKIVKDISKNHERRYFYCLDPDDNLIRIYDVKF
jgi:ADP-ribosylglycohydrolase/predicted enzyme related to lactoylglutathione lyase